MTLSGHWTLVKHGIGWNLIEFTKRSKIPLAFRAAAALLYVNNNTFDHTSIHLYSILRFELIEIMRASGMNTQSATGPAGREIQRSQHHFFLANFFGRKSLWLVATNIYWGWYLSPRTADQPSSDTTGTSASKRETQPLLFGDSLLTSQMGCYRLQSKSIKRQASRKAGKEIQIKNMFQYWQTKYHRETINLNNFLLTGPGGKKNRQKERRLMKGFIERIRIV